MRNVIVPIGGMTCSSCASRVEKGLRVLEGVTETNVNLTMEQASICYDPNQINMQQIETRIRQLGYEPIYAKAAFYISGMTCAACSSRLEKGLGRLPGVKAVQVNLALESASIDYLSAELTVQDMISQVEKLGYFAAPQNEITTDNPSASPQDGIWRFLVSAVLTFPLVWAMLSTYLPNVFGLGHSLLMDHWIQLLLATLVQFVVGKPFYIGAYKALRNKSANMDVLIALGTSAAYFYSFYLIMVWAIKGNRDSQPEMYLETSALLITLILLGKFLEALAKGRSKEAIQSLARLQAKMAVVIRGGEELHVSIAEVAVGDIVQIKPGERLPVDGEIIEGNGSVDESMLTGESIPIEKEKGDAVYTATVNRNGSFKQSSCTVEKMKPVEKTLFHMFIEVLGIAPSSWAW